MNGPLDEPLDMNGPLDEPLDMDGPFDKPVRSGITTMYRQ